MADVFKITDWFSNYASPHPCVSCSWGIDPVFRERVFGCLAHIKYRFASIASLRILQGPRHEPWIHRVSAEMADYRGMWITERATEQSRESYCAESKKIESIGWRLLMLPSHMLSCVLHCHTTGRLSQLNAVAAPITKPNPEIRTRAVPESVGAFWPLLRADINGTCCLLPLSLPVGIGIRENGNAWPLAGSTLGRRLVRLCPIAYFASC